MKIILFIDNLGAGGAQRQLVGLASMLKKKKYDVKVIYYQNSPFYEDYLIKNNVPYKLIPNAIKSINRIYYVSRCLKQESPDYVIAYQETPSLVACIAKILGGKFKLIVSERNTTQKLSYKDRIRFFLYRWANHIVPNSYSQSDFISTNYNNLSKKISVISNFVDLTTYKPNFQKRREVPYILIVSSIWPPKNVKRLLQSIALLKDRECKFKIKWFGIVNNTSESNKKYLEECLSMIIDLHIEDFISFYDKTPNIVKEYLSADYFCLPSLYEGTPNVICEAMSSGLPIICSNVCDNSIYVKDNKNGYLFNPLDIEDIANKIEFALKINKDEYLLLCKQSRILAEKLLSEETFINKYLFILN